MATGELDLAIRDFNKAIWLRPNKWVYYTNRGRLWDAKGNHDRAIADYSKAIVIDSKEVAAYINRGKAWHAKGKALPH